MKLISIVTPLSLGFLLSSSPSLAAQLGGWNTEGELNPFTINDPTLEVPGIVLSELDMVATVNSGFNNAPCVNEGCPASIYQTNSNSDFGGQAWQTGSVWRNNDLPSGSTQNPIEVAGSYYRFTIDSSSQVNVTLDQLSLLLSVNGQNTVQILAYGELGDTPGGLNTSNTNLVQLGNSVAEPLQSNRFVPFSLSLANLTNSAPFTGKATVYFFPVDRAGGNGFVPGTDIAIDNVGFTGEIGTPAPEIPEKDSRISLLILALVGMFSAFKTKV